MTNSASSAETFLRTLTEAREASGRKEWSAAVRLWEAVVAANPAQPDFWQALGDAQYANEDYTKALAAYYEALDLGAGFPFDTAYRIAQCHALNEQLDEALEWLERAFELGYRYPQQARDDALFEGLHDDQRFRDLVGLIDIDSLSRDDGWRYDLDFFAREIKRKAFHPWRNVAEADFDAAIEQLRGDIPELSEYEILVELRRIITLLGDGHANVFFGPDHPLAPATLPAQFYLFEEGLYIIAAKPEHADLLGLRVTLYGEHPIQQIIDVVTPTVPCDCDQWLKLKIPYVIREPAILHALGLIQEADRVALTLLDSDGNERQATLMAGDNLSMDELYYALPSPAGWEFLPETLDAPLPRYIRNQATYYWFEYLAAERAVYFQFNRVRDSATEDFATFTERLFRFIDDHDVQKLVIDLRNNNGGNTYLEMPFLHRLIGNRINQRGRLFVIIGRRTFSAAQNFAMLIERHTEAIFAGEPTGSSPVFVGETIPVELPYSKTGLNVSDLYWQSSWPLDNRTWLAPLLYLPPTFAAYSENRDPVMEAILALDDHLPGV